MAEALAKESLNYKTTDVDDRPKNAAGRGGLSICLAPCLLIAACVFEPPICPSSSTFFLGLYSGRTIRIDALSPGHFISKREKC